MTNRSTTPVILLRTFAAAAAAVAMTAAATSPAVAEELASASTSTSGGATTGSGIVTIVATAKAFRPARQNGSANLTITYDCTAIATPALRTHVPTCFIVTDAGDSYSDPSDVTPGEAATSAGTVTLIGSSAKICASGAGRMALDGSLQTANAPCTLINLAL